MGTYFPLNKFPLVARIAYDILEKDSPEALKSANTML